MKALVYHGPKEMTWEDYKEPTITDNEVLIKVKSVGICGSDLHGYLGLTGRRIAPMVMGHEFSGEVSKIGSKVTKVAVGDRVTVQPIVACGKCEFCNEGYTNRCTDKKVFGVMDYDGALSEYVSADENLIFKLPDSMSFDEGSLIEPMSVSYSAVKRLASVMEGKSVLVIGAGTIGYFASLWAKYFGAGKIFFSDIIQHRLDLVNKDHVDAVINAKDQDLVETLKSHNDGKKVDIIIEAVGLNSTVNQGLSVLSVGGTCLWIGNSQPTVEISMQQIVTTEVSIIGTYMFTHEEFGEVMSILDKKPFEFTDVMSIREPMSKATEVFNKVIENPDSILKAVVYLD